MDHSDVVRLNAVERYLLGELSPDLREQFEEHYFDCSACAADVKALATFMTASRLIFQEDHAAKAPSPGRQTVRPGWFGWLRPVVAVPAIAALAAVVIFQMSVTIPHLKEQAATQRVAQIYASSYRLQGTTRGENTSRVSIGPDENFALDFDFTPSQNFQSYKGTLVDPSGKTVLTFDVKAAEANKELHLVVPGNKVHSGIYDLVFVGENGTLHPDQKSNEVQRLSFTVEVRPR
ncbi:MAG TPA: zf-HC2 domain-containing protein [Candidatus Sulfotelmatobacter sp.]|nr:zf-HC2 domain-containing protein [Candidatus Sulfotelmatobacter sp.]